MSGKSINEEPTPEERRLTPEWPNGDCDVYAPDRWRDSYVLPAVPLARVARDSWRIAEDKGFHAAENGTGIDRRLMLIVSELAEAQDELRSGHEPTEVYFNAPDDGGTHPRPVSDYGTMRTLAASGLKPEGFGVELADAVIRIFDLAEEEGINIGALIDVKLACNATRPRLHGRGF